MLSQIMHDGSGDANEQVVGVIFPSVGVPSGAFITEARVIFDVDEVRPGMSDKSVTVNIYGEANTNPAAPTTTASDLSNRVPTAAAVTWVPETSVNAHDDLITPDIRAIVQEIVDLPGWTPGNPMGILFGHVTGTGSRWVESFSTNNGIDTPALTVTYSASDMRTNAIDELYSVTGRPDGAEEGVPTGSMYLTSSDYEMVHDGSAEQVVGLVFPAVNVPPGATVTAANVIFDVDEVRPGASDADVTISIYGQVGPAAAVTETRYDLTARPATASSVIWQPEPSVGEHDDLLTPDISAVVDEIVNHCSWTAGSGLGIMFGHMTGSGSRWVESFRNNNGVDTPALSVSYLAPSSTPTVCDAPPLTPPAPPPPPPPPPGGGTLVMASVTGRPDGAEESVPSGNMYLTSSDYEMVHDGGGEQVVGIRFPSVGVPAGVTVTDAYVLFDVDEVRPGASDADVTISVFGEKDVNAAAIGGGAFDLSSRTPTAAAVSWQPGPSANVHDELKTSDLSPIVNEIINLQGWAEGNPMGILFGHVAGSGSRWVVRRYVVASVALRSHKRRA